MKTIFFVVALIVSSLAIADCPHLYPRNTPIKISGAVELCNDRYVTLYDQKNRAVLLVSELVQPGGHVVQRKDSFHKDSRVKNPVTPSEYEHSGFDRGHMAPADNSVSAYQMYESFLMTNMTPMVPELNRGRWRLLEQKVQNKVVRIGIPVHVVTAAEYKSHPNLGTIPVPEGFIKVAYYPTGTIAQYTRNLKSDRIVELSVTAASDKIKYVSLPQ